MPLVPDVKRKGGRNVTVLDRKALCFCYPCPIPDSWDNLTTTRHLHSSTFRRFLSISIHEHTLYLTPIVTQFFHLCPYLTPV